MIRSFDSSGRRHLQHRAAPDSPERQRLQPAPPALQICPESLTRALLAEENRQTLKLVGRLRWAIGTTRN